VGRLPAAAVPDAGGRDGYGAEEEADMTATVLRGFAGPLRARREQADADKDELGEAL
jgi:hypothetical protein